MKENWLKEELYRRLSKKESDSDLDQLWLELEAKRYPQKRRRPLWFWFVPVLFISFACLYMIVPNMVDSSTIKSNDNSLSPRSDLSDKSPNHIAGNTDSAQGNISVQVTETTVGRDHLTVPRNSDLDILMKSEASNQFNGDQASIDHALSYQGLANHMKDIGSSSIIDLRNESTQEELVRESDIHFNDEVLVSRSIFMLSQIEGRPLSLLNSRVPNLNELSPYPNRLPKIENASSYNHIGFSSSYGHMASDLTGNSSMTPGYFTKEFFNERSRLENSQNYLDLTLFYKHYFRNNITIQTGLSYQHYTSKYQVMSSDVTTEIISDTLEIYVVNDEILDVKIGDVPITKTTHILTTNYLKYRMIRVPVLIGYELGINDKMSLSLATGVSVGILMIGDSRFLNPDPLSESYLGFEDSGYSKSFALESISQLSVNRTFSGRWVASIGMKYNIDLKDRLRADMPGDQRLSSFNFMLGIGRRF